MCKLAVWLILGMSAAAEVRQVDAPSIEHVALEELRATNTPGAAVAVVSGDQVIFRMGTAWRAWIQALRLRPICCFA
jgi:hypothetical protein